VDRPNPRPVRREIQRELRAATGAVPVARARSMDDVVKRSTARSDFDMLLLTTFAVSALLFRSC
jgi:hypothetical protein